MWASVPVSRSRDGWDGFLDGAPWMSPSGGQGPEALPGVGRSRAPIKDLGYLQVPSS